MYPPVFRADAQRHLKAIGDVDLAIGLAGAGVSWMVADVARLALDGAHRHYPHLRTVLIHAKAGRSNEENQLAVQHASSNGHAVVTGRYHGAAGRGNATAALLDAALALDAKAVVVLDSAGAGLKPDWVAGLADLILQNNADLVLPRYRQWPAPHGWLNDVLAYPLFRALWGTSLRHPLAPDFAVSPQLATALLDEDIWGTAAGGNGLVPWLATFAAVQNWRVAQSALGEKSSRNGKTGSANGNSLPDFKSLTTRAFRAGFQDLVTVLFRLAYRYQQQWPETRRFRSAPTLTEFAPAAPPTFFPDADVLPLLDGLALGWMEYRREWEQMLTAQNLAQVESLAALPAEHFYFPADLWARVIFDAVVAFNLSNADPVRLVLALLPLVQGRLAAFWQEVAGLAPVAREGTVAAQAVEFEENRAYFKMCWQANQPRPYRPGWEERSLI